MKANDKLTKTHRRSLQYIRNDNSDIFSRYNYDVLFSLVCFTPCGWHSCRRRFKSATL